MRGKLIVFEGNEGSGKTSALKRLEQHLIQQSDVFRALVDTGKIAHVVSTREPGGTVTGAKIRTLLLDPSEQFSNRAELLLLIADRAQHVDQYLRPMIEEGSLVLCDRYIYSTLAYQGYGRGLDIEMINQLNLIATQGLTPDLVIWLDIDPEIGLTRARCKGEHDRLEQETLAFHDRIREGYTELMESGRMTNVCRISADRSQDEVFEAVLATVTDHLKQWYKQESLSTCDRTSQN